MLNSTFLVALTAARLVAAPGAPVADPGIAPPRTPTTTRAPVRVVATLPVYAEIAREIGGTEVQVVAIADPAEDAHFVRPKPSFALEIRRADAFITTGLDLELWVPALLSKAGNARVGPGAPGHIIAHTGITLLDVPSSVDRAAGDIHIYGNPHIYTDPLNAIQIARNIAEGLKRVAPDRAAAFDRGLAAFTDQIHRRLFGDRLVDMLQGETLERLARSGKLFSFLSSQAYEGKPLTQYLGGWLAAAEPFRGKKIICYHKDWAYFEQRFDVTCAEYVEAKPGIPPTPGHVARLIRMMQDQGIRVLLSPNYYDRSKSEVVTDRVGGTAVIVPMQPGGDTGVQTYFDLVDTWVTSLANAFRQSS
ncbi:MAG TPA: metal ABC transporter substrate-binding protein [Longimicrobiales bacterium]